MNSFIYAVLPLLLFGTLSYGMEPDVSNNQKSFPAGFPIELKHNILKALPGNSHILNTLVRYEEVKITEELADKIITAFISHARDIASIQQFIRFFTTAKYKKFSEALVNAFKRLKAKGNLKIAVSDPNLAQFTALLSTCVYIDFKYLSEKLGLDISRGIPTVQQLSPGNQEKLARSITPYWSNKGLDMLIATQKQLTEALTLLNSRISLDQTLVRRTTVKWKEDVRRHVIAASICLALYAFETFLLQSKYTGLSETMWLVLSENLVMFFRQGTRFVFLLNVIPSTPVAFDASATYYSNVADVQQAIELVENSLENLSKFIKLLSDIKKVE